MFLGFLCVMNNTMKPSDKNVFRVSLNGQTKEVSAPDGLTAARMAFGKDGDKALVVKVAYQKWM
jgi:hypothetical protein